MYTVDEIENKFVRLENRDTCEIFEVKKDMLPSNIKEGDILEYRNGRYYINEVITNNNKRSIKSRFDSLKK